MYSQIIVLIYCQLALFMSEYTMLVTMHSQIILLMYCQLLERNIFA